MYRVLLFDNPNRKNPKIVHEPYSYGEKIKDSEVYLSLNGLGISTFEFTFNINKRLSRLFTLSRFWMLQEIKKFFMVELLKSRIKWKHQEAFLKLF